MIRLPKSAAESSVKSSGKSSQEADQVIATWSSLCVPTDPRQIGRISIRFLLIKTISTWWKTVDLEFIYFKKMTKYFILFQMCTSLIGANDDWMANQWMRLSISDHLHRLWLLSHLKLDVGRDLGVGLKGVTLGPGHVTSSLMNRLTPSALIGISWPFFQFSKNCVKDISLKKWNSVNAKWIKSRH